MQLEVGSVLEGKVTSITKFGAFVQLPDHKIGMVHISEIAPTFVKEITDYVKQDDVVKVQVLAIGQDGKISLSMKSLAKPGEGRSHVPSGGATRQGGGRQHYQNKGPAQYRPPRKDNGFHGAKNLDAKPSSFEDMLSKFKSDSDEKMSDLKRSVESKRGSFPKQRQSKL